MSNGIGQTKTFQRRMAIAQAYEAGDNTVEIAVRFNISRQRVEQIARDQGMPHRTPQRRPSKATR